MTNSIIITITLLILIVTIPITSHATTGDIVTTTVSIVNPNIPSSFIQSVANMCQDFATQYPALIRPNPLDGGEHDPIPTPKPEEPIVNEDGVPITTTNPDGLIDLLDIIKEPETETTINPLYQQQQQNCRTYTVCMINEQTGKCTIVTVEICTPPPGSGGDDAYPTIEVFS